MSGNDLFTVLGPVLDFFLKTPHDFDVDFAQMCCCFIVSVENKRQSQANGKKSCSISPAALQE